ncbi:hypothetical protein ELI51_19260 [Rhizobium leguminosarum]|nr:hypothetical protein ELI50_18550 [Rhizobium leguminosarum]TAU42450.1 hypothetical protein ELI51_19260 [Rhizobium leguminosarum]
MFRSVRKFGTKSETITKAAAKITTSPCSPRRIFFNEFIVRIFLVLEQVQEKCEAVFRPELRKNKKLERFCVSMKS